MAYTKLFASIITSTIWSEDNDTKVVWITMLALSDKSGEVQGSVPGLARLAGVSIATCESALQKFLSPDPYSRSKDDEGRRIEVIDGGWRLLNHKKYRDMASKADMQEAETLRKQRYREQLRRNGKSAPVPGVSRPCPEAVPVFSTHTDAYTDSEAKADAYPESEKEKNNTVTRQAAGVGFSLEPEQGKLTKKEKRERFKPPTFEEAQDYGKEIGLTDAQCAYVFDHYQANGWKAGKVPMADWKSCWRKARLGWDFGQVNEKAKETQYDVTPEQMAEWTQNRIDREREREERAAAKARGETWEEKSDF